MTDMDTKERTETKTREKKLSPVTMELVEIERPAYRIIVGRDIVLQDMLDSSYWVHHLRKLRGGEVIEVVCEDMTWSAELLVRHRVEGGVKMGVHRFTAFTVEAEAKGKINKMKTAQDQKAAKDAERPAFVIEWNIGKRKHLVRPNEPGSKWIGDGHASKEDAELWIRNYKKAQAR